jgi:hypothetical protein
MPGPQQQQQQQRLLPQLQHPLSLPPPQRPLQRLQLSRA